LGEYVRILLGSGGVEPAAADDSEDAVAIPLRVGQPLEQVHERALGAHVPVGVLVERARGARLRDDAELVEADGSHLMAEVINCAGGGEVAFAERNVGGGVIIVDDYGYTIGCKKAVDDFVQDRSVCLQRINRNVRSWVKTD
jgi:hypothetical protein